MGNKVNQSIKITNEDKILLLCARTQLNPEIKSKLIKLIHSDIEWEYLLKVAAIHRLTPLLYHNLNSICPELVPEDILDELKNYFNVNVRKNLLMTGELIKILKLFKTNGIDVIPYKGPVLADLAYGNIIFREFGDIDILINKLDVLTAKNLMISNGYELYAPIKINDKFYMKLESEFQFINKNTGTIIELKWKIEGNFFYLPKNSNNVLKHLEKIDSNGFEICTFSPVNLILILCIHAAKHDWNRLSWICDISELVKSQENINWQEILDKSEKMNIKRILLVNLLLANDLFKLELSYDILMSINSDSSILSISNQIKKRIFENKSLNIFHKLISDLEKRDSLIYGFRDCINGLTRPTYADFIEISLPEFLIFLYFLIRPFLLLKRYGKRSI